MSWALLGPSSTVFCDSVTQSHQYLSSSRIKSHAALAEPMPQQQQQFPTSVPRPRRLGWASWLQGLHIKHFCLLTTESLSKENYFSRDNLLPTHRGLYRHLSESLQGGTWTPSPAARLSQAGT